VGNTHEFTLSSNFEKVNHVCPFEPITVEPWGGEDSSKFSDKSGAMVTLTTDQNSLDIRVTIPLDFDQESRDYKWRFKMGPTYTGDI